MDVRCESRIIKKAEHQRIDAFELWCWRRLLRVPWTTRRSNQSILRLIQEINLNIHWKNWCWSYNTLAILCEDLTHLKRLRCWERLKAGGGVTEDEMVGWHHWFDGHEFEQTLGVGDGQESLVCFSPWGCKELDTTEWLINNKNSMVYMCILPTA